MKKYCKHCERNIICLPASPLTDKLLHSVDEKGRHWRGSRCPECQANAKRDSYLQWKQRKELKLPIRKYNYKKGKND